MENTKFTPGPWEVERNTGRGSWIGNDNQWSALSCGATDEEAQANAQLISKAPELLAKLQSILNVSEDKGIEGCTWGDTDMSSTDVVFGYNLALEHVKRGIEELIKQATEIK